MFKFITAFGANSFSVAGLYQTHHPIDTERFRFSFIVYGVSVQDFCDTVHKLYTNAQDSLHYCSQDDVIVKAATPRDTLRITRYGSDLYITRGNLKVIYAGSVNDINELCKELKQSYGEYLQTFQWKEE